MLKEKEYKYFKTAKKTAIENNLILCDGLYHNAKRLFDFSFLDDIYFKEEEKEVLKREAIKTVCASNKELYYGSIFDQFNACDGIATFYMHRVYTNNGTKHVYDIFELASLKHYSNERKSIYDRHYQVTTYECSPIYRKPLTDIEL